MFWCLMFCSIVLSQPPCPARVFASVHAGLVVDPASRHVEEVVSVRLLGVIFSVRLTVPKNACWDLPDNGLEFHADFPYPVTDEGVSDRIEPSMDSTKPELCTACGFVHCGKMERAGLFRRP